jgi:AraC-like DNA-binding protein
MGNKKTPILLAQQNSPEGTQKNDLLQTQDNPNSNKESTPCRLEYLKKLYYFNFTENDDNQAPVSQSTFSDPEIENLMKPGIPGTEFCEKYCFEKSICSGSVIILLPKDLKTVPENDLARAKDNLAGVSNPFPFHENLSWVFDDGIVKRNLLAGENLLLKNTLAFIEASYKDYKFSVDLLAMQLNMSVSQVNRKLNLLTGHPAGYLIRLFRLQRSAAFLLEGNKNVSEICFETGFNGLSYFSRSFRKHYGCSPSQYKKAMAEKLNIMRQKDN